MKKPLPLPKWFHLVDKHREWIRRVLLRWFKKHKRDLPWRRNRDPYRIWISEIMLQQTRVETVIPYFQRFLQRFPKLSDLAKAEEDQVLKVWEGLGYYTRARNLHKTARILMQDYHGKFPTNAEEWRKLPGVGRYTAGAIAGIAFQECVPVLDGNVMRVLARMFAITSPLNRTKVNQALWLAAGALVPRKNPGDFNQALMELGARICLPKNPHCSECPLQENCAADLQNLQNRIPKKKAAKVKPHYEVVAAAIKKNGRYLLGKRPPEHLLAGLWEFPGGKVEAGETHTQALQREIQEELGIAIQVNNHILSVDHSYSHYTVTLHLYSCTLAAGKPQALYHAEIKWIPRSQFERYAFPAANQKFFPYL